MHHVGELLASLSRQEGTKSSISVSLPSQGSVPDWQQLIYKGLDGTVKDYLVHRGFHVYSGKVRDVLTRQGSTSSHPTMLLVHTDRLTAFDKMITWVPFKGAILTSIAAFWLKKAKEVVPTHFIDQVDERTLLCHAATPIKVEVVIRGYLAGSMMRAYAQGQRQFGGVTLPDNLVPYQKLPSPIITPTTKAAAFEHDIETTPQEIIKSGLCDNKTWNLIEDYAHRLFALGTKVLGDAHWILVDTKYEFGVLKNQQLVVIDEVHTPDSSRFWVQKTYEERLKSGLAPDMLDKEVIRRWLLDQGYQGEGPVPSVPLPKVIELAQTYLQVLETLSGQPLLAKDTLPREPAMWEAQIERLLL